MKVNFKAKLLLGALCASMICGYTPMNNVKAMEDGGSENEAGAMMIVNGSLIFCGSRYCDQVERLMAVIESDPTYESRAADLIRKMNELAQRYIFAAPERASREMWRRLAHIIGETIPRNPSDNFSVRIYAAYMGMEVEDMRQLFIREGHRDDFSNVLVQIQLQRR